MTSRRIVPSDQVLEKDGLSPVAADALGPSNTAPAVPLPVILKLLGFTFAMVTVPLGTYFALNATVGNSTFAGASAAIMANVVLMGYIIVAWKEDQSDQLEAERQAKKAD